MTVEYVKIDKFIERNRCELVFCAIISDHRGRSRDSRLHAAETRRSSGGHNSCTFLSINSTSSTRTSAVEVTGIPRALCKQSTISRHGRSKFRRKRTCNEPSHLDPAHLLVSRRELE